MISVMLDAMCRVSLKEKKLEDINERMFAKASERGRLAREITLDYLVFLGGGKSLERSQNTHSTASSKNYRRKTGVGGQTILQVRGDYIQPLLAFSHLVYCRNSDSPITVAVSY